MQDRIYDDNSGILRKRWLDNKLNSDSWKATDNMSDDSIGRTFSVYEKTVSPPTMQFREWRQAVAAVQLATSDVWSR